MKGRVLLTGASGFVGMHLSCYLFENKFFFDTLTRNQLLAISPNMIIDGDVIVHLAGMAHDLKKTSNAQNYYNVNFELTKQLFDTFLKSGAKKFIFISSVKAVADSVEGVLTEDHFPNPQTHYGKSKLMAEQYIQSQPLPDGKFYYILRPCMIHGPGNKGNLTLLYKFVQKGIPYPLAVFRNKRSFLSIENLCFVMKELFDNDISSGVYHLSDDDALSTNEVVSILAESLGKNARFLAVPKIFVKLLAYIGDVFGLPLTSERLDKLTENYIVSNKKIQRALGRSLPLASRDGLSITASSFKKH